MNRPPPSYTLLPYTTLFRSLGYEAMRKRFGDRLSLGLLGSQNAMTGLVMGLRLLPFISFDIVSYAAGLTPLKPWRFALATLIGVTPVSFALAHFGGELIHFDLTRGTLIALALGTVTLIPVLVVYLRRRKVRAEEGEGAPDRAKNDSKSGRSGSTRLGKIGRASCRERV